MTASQFNILIHTLVTGFALIHRGLTGDREMKVRSHRRRFVEDVSNCIRRRYYRHGDEFNQKWNRDTDSAPIESRIEQEHKNDFNQFYWDEDFDWIEEDIQ